MKIAKAKTQAKDISGLLKEDDDQINNIDKTAEAMNNKVNQAGQQMR